MSAYFLFNSRPDFELLASSPKKYSFIGYRHSNQSIHMLKIFERKFKMGKFVSFPMTVFLDCGNEESDDLATSIEDVGATLNSPSIERFSVQLRTCAALSELTRLPTYFVNSDDYEDSACFAIDGRIISMGITQGYDSEAQKSCVVLSKKSGKTRCAVIDFEGHTGTLDLLSSEFPWLNPKKATKTDSSKVRTASFWPDSLWPTEFGKIADLSPINEIDVDVAEIVRFDAKSRKPKISYKKNGRI